MSNFSHYCLCLLLGLALAGCAAPPGRGADGKLVVGMELEYPPFETVDDAGKPAGVSVDLAMALGAHLGREVVIRDFKFKGLPPALAAGQVDLVISSMTPTPERAQTIDFSIPYATIGLALLVQKDSTLTDAESLNHSGITVAVKSGTTGETFADKHLSAARILRLDHAGAGAIEVAQGKADAFIYDQSSILEFADKNPETTRALPAPIQTETWAIGIRKGDDQLRQQVDAFLREFAASGGFDKLADKHLSAQKARFQKAGVPFIF